MGQKAGTKGEEKVKPYRKHQLLPKLKAQRNRLERLLVSGLPVDANKYVEAASKKLGKAIELLEARGEEK